jgi:hypothetical protein
MCILLLLASSLQDLSADEVLKKLQETIEKAPALRLEFQGENQQGLKGEAKTTTFHGVLLLKGGSRASFSEELSEGARRVTVKFISDGSKIWRTHQGTVALPREFGSQLACAIARGGLCLTPYAVSSLLDSEYGLGRIEKAFDASNLKLGADEGKDKTLTYDLTIEGRQVWEVKLVYDPVSFALRKRTSSRKDLVQERVLTETYSQVDMKREIPDDAFVLPKD